MATPRPTLPPEIRDGLRRLGEEALLLALRTIAQELARAASRCRDRARARRIERAARRAATASETPL